MRGETRDDAVDKAEIMSQTLPTYTVCVRVPGHENYNNWLDYR